jgi:hypothetical protein
LAPWRLRKDRHLTNCEEHVTHAIRDDAAIGQRKGSHVITGAAEASGSIEAAIGMEESQARAGAASDGSNSTEDEDSAIRHLPGSEQ